MKVLILGGTGAIGKYLVELMASENTVFVTSRRQHENHGNTLNSQLNYLL